MKWWFCHAIWLSVSLSPLFGAFMLHTIFNGDLVNSIWIFGLAVGQPNRLTIWLVWHKLAFCVRRMDVNTPPSRHQPASQQLRILRERNFIVFRISFGVCSVSVCLLPYSVFFENGKTNRLSWISNWNLWPAEGHDQRSITFCVCISYWQIGILRNGCMKMKSSGTGCDRNDLLKFVRLDFITKMLTDIFLLLLVCKLQIVTSLNHGVMTISFVSFKNVT